MSRICFVIDEINPVKPGGAGSFVSNLAQALLVDGHEIILLLDLSKAEFDRFNSQFRPNWRNGENCRSYHVDTLCTSIDCRREDFLSRYMWESYRYDFACRQIYEHERPDLFEFVDYCGPAFYALCAKISALSYQDTHIAVRIHGSIGIIDRYAQTKAIDFDRFTIYKLESYSLKLAETVLYPSPSLLEAYYDIKNNPWFGNAILSKPIVTNYPSREGEDPNAHLILYYGRLSSVKGVDLFIDAALNLLYENEGRRLQFDLVGIDSMEPPAENSHSFQEYLLKRIPRKFQAHFSFSGLLDLENLNTRLPFVRFAVFPSYFETFGFAAHELKFAGVPILVSDIPAFHDYLEPEKDAIFFDGSLADLIYQMKRLDGDNSLRERLSKVTPQLLSGPDTFYGQIPDVSWMRTKTSSTRLNLLICILENHIEKGGFEKTLTSLKGLESSKNVQIIHLKKPAQSEDNLSSLYLFGQKYLCYDTVDNQLSSHDVHTSDVLLIQCEGDEVDLEYIERGFQILAEHSQVSFVTCWKWMRSNSKVWLNTSPLAQMLEIAPFEMLSENCRCLMRTPANKYLEDIFDRNADNLGEIAYLWKLETPKTIGVQIPKPLITESLENFQSINNSSLSYLVMQNDSPVRMESLQRYLLMLHRIFPFSHLPLQEFWAQKSGWYIEGQGSRNQSYIVKRDWRTRLAHKLGHGGPMSQKILAVLKEISTHLLKR